MTSSIVLVGARDLVDDAGVLAALDARRLRREVLDREACACAAAARHPPAGAVRRRAEGRSSLPSPRTMYEPVPIEPGMMPEVAAAGPDRALAGDEQVHAVVASPRPRSCGGRRSARSNATAFGERGLGPRLQSSASITARLRARVLLRPEQVAAVGVHLGRAGEEHRQVAVGQVGVVRQAAARRRCAARRAPCRCCATRSAASARPASGRSSRQSSMKWLPPPSVPICCVARASQLPARRRCSASKPAQNVVPAGGRPGRGAAADRPGRRARRSRPGSPPRSRARSAAEVVGQVGRGQGGAHGGHAAADVDADRGRATAPAASR